jgi:hypothetical protein
VGGVPGDLTTLANVKAWRDPPVAANTDDAILQGMITAASTAILNYLQRVLVAKNYSEVRNGQGTQGMMLRQFPIISVASVMVGQVNVPAPQNPDMCGFVFDAEKGMLYLRGYAFCAGFQNISVNYTAGFLVQSELQTPGASLQVSCGSLAQLWAANYRVVDANGNTLTTTTGSPSAGFYAPPTGPDGFYLFATGVAAPVAISYSFTPRDIERAAIVMVILEYNRRSRIGVNSKGLAGEQMNFYTQKAMTPNIEQWLQPYMDVVPNE